MMNTAEILEVVKAYQAGMVIESRTADAIPGIRGNEWVISRKPVWNFEKYEYRVKSPEVKVVDMWQWVVRTAQGIQLTAWFYEQATGPRMVNPESEVLMRAEWTKISIEVPA
jgi:hypothetical protein